MKKNYIAELGLIILTVFAAAAGVYAIPEGINYQGKIEVDGEPFSGTAYFRFAIVDASGMITYWSNDGLEIPQTDIELSVTNGLYNVVLGKSMNPLPADVFQNDELYLRIWFEDGPSGIYDMQLLSPDQPLTNVSFAYQAGDVYDREISPKKVSIAGYGEVIDALGQWVGDPTGLEGPTGPQGDTGPLGPQGHTGTVGPQGDTGPIGPQGNTGTVGPQGDTGPIGPQGHTGPVGPQGDTGPAGPQGHTGPVGPQGDTGPLGPQGHTGTVGPQGDTGPIGPQGHTGPVGPQGDTGPAGPQGHTGPVGPQGDTGTVGPQGDTGPLGPQGHTGPVGPQGNTGPVGPQGDTGPLGPQGATGPQGDTGPTGPIGGANMQLLYNDNGLTGGADIYYNDSSSYLGIGTSSPASILHLYGQDAVRFKITSIGDGWPIIDLYSDSKLWQITQHDTVGYFGVWEDGTLSRLIIKEGGDVGIGTTDPVSKLEVNGTITATAFVGDGSGLTGVGSDPVPIGGIIPWAKNIPGVPALPANYVECNGQVLNDPQSPLNGQTIPDLNGASGSQRFLRGSTSSGAVGGADTHSHSIPNHYPNGQWDGDWGDNFGPQTGASSSLPSYYETVMVMRIK